MIKRAVLLSSFLGLMAGGAIAQDTSTLADIRQDLSVLTFELQKLKRELSTTGGTTVGVSGSTLDRVNAIEAELQRLTTRTEEMQFRIDQVVTDGTNRIGDLEFRVCEVEPGCDLGTLGQTKPIGGEAPAPTPAPAPAPEPDVAGHDLPLTDPSVQLAASEEQDFRRAEAALENGEYQAAADQFAAFRETYPGGPLEAAALVGHGRALDGLGNTRDAARSYLNSYSGYPDSAIAPEALWRLGVSLATLGSVTEACVTLAEVPSRFPYSPFAQDAAKSRAGLNCQ